MEYLTNSRMPAGATAGEVDPDLRAPAQWRNWQYDNDEGILTQSSFYTTLFGEFRHERHGRNQFMWPGKDCKFGSTLHDRHLYHII